MSKLIDDELKKLIQKTRDIVKQMLPFLQEEVQSIISSRETSEHRIEHVLDRILDCLYSGFGEMEFKALNSYYATVNPQNAADYQRFYDEIMEDDPEQNNESTSDQAASPVVPEIHYPEIWLNIEKESVKKTKEFMKALFQSNIPGIERFAWHCTPIEPGYFRDHPNYKKVDEIFKKVYLVDMRTYESL